MENITYIDINKGFHRVGPFSPFDDEIYKSIDEAREYAAGGNATTSAYPGQVIKVLTEDEPKVFVIDRNYKLVSISESISTDSKLSVHFDCNSHSGTEAISITLPEGFILNTMTIKIDEAFSEGSYMSVDEFAPTEENVNNFIEIIDKDSTIIDGENGDEFIFNLTRVLNRKTKFYIFLNSKVPEEGHPTGKGILKIN